ncbi:MAG: hypothetical protein ACRDQ5_10000, partial [Sciscionella sp.]
MRARTMLVSTVTVIIVAAGLSVAVRGGAEPASMPSLVSVGTGGATGAADSVAPDIASDGGQVTFQSTAQLPVSTSVPVNEPPSQTRPAPPDLTGSEEPIPTPERMPATRHSGTPEAHGTKWATGPASRIYLRDPSARTTALLSDPSTVDAEASSVSGDGRLVSYVGTHRDGSGDDIYVADRNPGGANPRIATHRITGTTGDVRLQRTIGCQGPSTEDYGNNAQCRPELSTDGGTIAFPARIAPVSPSLIASEAVSDTESGAKSRPLRGSVLDFDFVDPYQPERSTAVRLDVAGSQPVTFRPASITGDTTAFAVTSSTCLGKIRPGERCSVGVSFHPPASSCPSYGAEQSFSATLHTDATTPAGQSALTLVGGCRRGDTGTATYRLPTASPPTTFPAAAPGGCQEPDLTGLAPQPIPLGVDNSDNQLADVGAVQLGRANLVAFPVTATTYSYLRFLPAADCDLRLVVPPEAQRLANDRNPPCSDGEFLEIEQACTAYLLARPTTLSPGVATLDAAGTVFRLVGTGFRNVVIARRDPSGHGDFAGSGRPAAKIVSVDSHGNVVNASEPSVSGDGHLVAFSSINAIARPATDTPSARVY